jgi:hypothetical protein
MSTSRQYQVTVTIDGVDYGVWDTFSGGEVASEEVKYRPGGMAAQVSLGGSTTVENITVSRLYVLERDHVIVHQLMSRVGRADVTINKQPLDVNGAAFGRPLVYTGKLQRVMPPEHDSDSDDPAMIELEIGTNGSVG